MEFMPIEGADIRHLKPFLECQKDRACDHTVGCISEWAEQYRTEYAITENMLILRETSVFGSYYEFPVGFGSVDRALDAIDHQPERKGCDYIIYTFSREAADMVCEHFGQRVMAVCRQSDWDDYLYPIEQLQTFAGKKMHGQRNHLNAFKSAFPGYRYVEVTEQTLPNARDFLNAYDKASNMTDRGKLYELSRAKKLLEESERLGLKAGYLETDAGIVAMAIGEVQNDTLFVHVEKALTSVRGAFQAIVSEFALHAAEDGTVYCNREDDAGNLGLRKSKTDYHPCAKIEKHCVAIAGEITDL